MNFPDEIARWYLENKRNLPWRDTSDAYVIWLSEIILQQTRVEQGMPYFDRFLEHYPDIKSFAAASEDDILRLWQGLGYYSRGRNMLKTARLINEQYDGVFPVQYEHLIKLKGIGEYTAAAISSFAANEAKAVVDGNVFRVLARYFGIGEPINSTKGKKIFQGIADEVLNHDHPGLHNQAMMEFGAVLCRPKSPDCEICPVREGCFAYNNNKIGELPKKLKTVKVRDRYFNYLLVTDGDQVLMRKRDDTDIWANMYDLPLIETPSYIAPENVTKLLHTHNPLSDTFRILACYPEKLHLLTHQRIHTQFIHVENQAIKLEQKYFFIEVKNIKMLALPKILNLFLSKFFNL
ncbi:MAG TPA: A/G-specific adenine glycosylase [Mucilaginibacter sp.]|jgi:A/G-specific adenine glycosylase|nr:A/G-specific adenine glycosylase [Mucilaginibacter sp.]